MQLRKRDAEALLGSQDARHRDGAERARSGFGPAFDRILGMAGRLVSRPFGGYAVAHSPLWRWNNGHDATQRG